MAIVHNFIKQKSRCAESFLHSGSPRFFGMDGRVNVYPTAFSFFLAESESFTALEFTVLP